MRHPHECGVCCQPKAVTRIDSLVEETRDQPGFITHIYICEECLAKHLEMLTGYRVSALLTRWRKLRGLPNDQRGGLDSGG